MFNSLESCSQFPIGRCGTGAQCYLGILHEAYCRSQSFNRKLINRDGGRSHTFCTHLFSPKGLVTEEWHNCCWARSFKTSSSSPCAAMMDKCQDHPSLYL
uniref:Uncharacterized protein n=1 Tax=Opuntia streptacantha TaxID=393608 RepID=A0A7C9F2B4_OPUST